MALTNLSKVTGSGIGTLTDLNVTNLTGVAATFTGNVTIGGTLTYDDVTNIDSVGLITARSGVSITGGDLTLPDSIIHADDTNTKIRFPANDTVTVETAGTERLRITSGGRIAINADGIASYLIDARTDENPSSGVIGHFRNNQGNGKGSFLAVSSNLKGSYSMGMPDNTDAFTIVDGLGNDGTERLRIDSAGQVNINASTESVGGRVVIKNNVDYTTTDFDDNPTLYLLNGDRTTGISEAAIIFAGRNTAGSTFRAAISGNGSTGLKFYTTSNTESDDTAAMLINGSGNVGIGTIAPAGGSLLHVHGGDNSTKNHLRLSADRGLIARLGDTSGSAQSLFDLYGTDGSTQIVKFISGGDGFVNTGGNFGVGTNSPDTTLTVKGTSDGVLNLDTTDSRGTLMRFKENGTTKQWIGSAEGMGGGLSGDQDDMGLRAVGNIFFSANGAERIRIGDAGQIGIAGANYGTAGQVLTSGGASGAVSWTTVSGGGGGGATDKISEGNTEAETVDTGSDGHFKVTTEGTERLRVQKGGNVVIGTTVEDTGAFRTLHMHGDYTRIKLTDQFSGTGNTDGLDIQCSGGSVYHKFYENGSIYFSTNNTNRFQLSHDGNVKILTSGGMLDGNGSLIMSVSGTERLRVGSAGQIGVGGANYGTSGQVLTSGGASGAVSWTTVSGGGGGGSDKISEGNTEAEVVDTGSDGHFKVTTEGVERMRILADGRMIVGGGSTVYGNSNADDLVVGHTGSMHRGGITIVGASNQDARLAFSKGTSYFDSLAGYIVYEFSGNRMSTYVNMSERFAIDADGKILIGHNGGNKKISSSALEIYKGSSSNDLSIINSSADDSAGARSGNLNFGGRQSGGETTTLANIGANHDGSADDQKGNLMFRTNDGNDSNSPTERARFDSTGSFLIGRTSAYNGSPGETCTIQGDRHGLVVYQSSNANYTGINIRNTYANNNGNNVSGNMITFHDQGGTERGKIASDGNSTSYITSSDYRLKENVVAMSDGIARLKQLKPSRFNWIEHPGTTVDGFIAHEVTPVVPEAVNGEKDAVDEDDKPVYQGVDNSKIVPLLAGALKEAVTKIEALEARIAALES